MIFKSPDLYKEARQKYPWIGSRIFNGVIQDVTKRHQKLRYPYAIGTKSVPSYRRYSFRDDRAKLKKVDKNYVLRLALLSRSAQSEFTSMEFIIWGKRLRSHHYQILDQLCDDQHVTVQVVQRTDKSKKKWFAHLHFEQEANKHSELIPERTLYVHPFSTKDDSILQCYMQDKPMPRIEDIEFDSALQTSIAYEKHSKAISRKYRQDRGGGKRGHGLTRAIRDKKQRLAKYDMSATTFNQQRAAFITRRAVQWKCGKICYISPAHAEVKKLCSWPWYQLGQFIANACEREKITYEELDTKFLEDFKKSFDSVTK